MSDNPIQKVIMIGRGAVGTVMGTILQDVLADDFAFVADPERIERYMKNPLVVNGRAKNYHYISDAEEFGPADLVLIATKYGALPEAMDLAEPFMQDSTIFMPCINGLKSEEDLRARFPKNITLRTIAQKMDANYHDNHVDYTQQGELVFGGENEEQNAAAARVAELFEDIGLPYVLSENILFDQWNKLMLNCGLNQTCAAWNATYGEVLANPEYKDVFVNAMEETRQVANACGIPLTKQHLQDWLDAVAALDPNSMPSMLQDVRAGRPTEEELFSAYVTKIAREKGIETPALDLLKEKVDAIDAKNAAA